MSIGGIEGIPGVGGFTPFVPPTVPATPSAPAVGGAPSVGGVGRAGGPDFGELVLDGLDRPTASFLFGAPDDLRAAIEQAVGSGVQPDTADSAPTTTAPGTTAPGAPSVPNREGG